MAGRPDPKPQRSKREPIRVVDSLATRRIVLRFRECCVCGEPAATGHHVIAKGGPHYGDDLDGNIVPVCGSGTTGCHGKIENGDVEARMAVGLHILRHRIDVILYVQDKLGPDAGDDWLRRRYYIEAV